MTALPADMWDALEFVAESEGGIGAGAFGDGLSYSLAAGQGHPRCLFGAAVFLDGERNEDVWSALRSVVSANDTDRAIERINRRLGVSDAEARVPFSLLMAELGLTRGET